jgi:cell division transport system permease protein
VLDRISFLFGEALTAMRRNYTMTFAAIITAAVSLFLIGGLGYVYVRTTEYAQSLTGRFEMRVILKDGTPVDQISAVANTIRLMDGVKAVFWIPRERAWARDKAKNPDLTEGVENPYPDAFKVTLRDVHSGDLIARKIHSLPAVVEGPDGVQYLRDVQRFVDDGLHTLRWVGGAVGGLLFVAAGLLIYNAIKLTVLARRLEIRVMQLVGASRFTIRIPFLIEGIVQGTMGGLVAGLLLLLSNHAFATFLATLPGSSAFASPPPFPFWPLTAILCMSGAVYGLLCSNAAVHVPLKFR